MAGKRRAWESLSRAYRDRLSRGGVSKSSYERGDNLSKARGHGKTPEHPREAARNPGRYREYAQKRESRQVRAETPEDQAYRLNTAKDNAYRNIRGRLGHYFKYNDDTVRANVYGGEAQGETKPGMTLAQALWSAQADAEELRSRAEEQYRGNPWWYH